VAAHQWRQGDNWRIVGARKAIGIASHEELLSEYAVIAQAGKRVLLQEMVPGGDESLLISACYLDTSARCVADFNTRKLVQIPEIFGTGCIVQAANAPALSDATARLLETMRFTGIAEVEYKWDAPRNEYKLIEINPRPWDQHRLGKTCGVDLAYLAYCDRAGLPLPEVRRQPSESKWIAEDTFITAGLSLLWKGDPGIRRLFRHARGKRIYAIWSAKDPLPFVAYFAWHYIPGMLASALRVLWIAFHNKVAGRKNNALEQVSRKGMEKGKSHV
jgi:predicted ATP-grasp superfamily ATP-dependent carboligase